MKKMLWIVNPHAGRGAMRGKLIDCILTFQEAGFDVTLHVTEGCPRMRPALRRQEPGNLTVSSVPAATAHSTRSSPA